MFFFCSYLSLATFQRATTFNTTYFHCKRVANSASLSISFLFLAHSSTTFSLSLSRALSPNFWSHLFSLENLSKGAQGKAKKNRTQLHADYVIILLSKPIKKKLLNEERDERIQVVYIMCVYHPYHPVSFNNSKVIANVEVITHLRCSFYIILY